MSFKFQAYECFWFLVPMRNLLSWFFLITFFSSCFSHVVLVLGQCQSSQQSFLLQLKNSLMYNSSSSVNLVQWDQNTDCCNWNGVDCDAAGHVISLNLNNESISGGIENATGLFSLQHLKSLNLAYNRFNGILIPSRLVNLTNLTYLNLSNSGSAGQIPSSISGMTKLVILDLSSLNFLGSSVLKLENPNLSMFLQNFTEIRELYLDGVNISAHGNEWGKALSSALPNIQVLSLSNCFLSGPISNSLAELRSLSVIRLDQNNLSPTDLGFLAEFKNLTSLRLSYCGLSGTFPENVFRVPTLQNLDLSNNKLLQGSLPQFPQNLSLRTLMLSFTSFSGTLPDSIANLKNLSTIELSSCNFTGPIPTSMATLAQIVYLDLSFNNFTGPIPSFYTSKNLAYLDLSHNLLSDEIPSNWEQLQNLSYVDLRFNFLNGSIPSSLFAIPSLQKLQLGNNQFSGQVPEFSDASSSELDTLDLSDNSLEGPIPMSIFELRKLNILLLSFNNLNGTVFLDNIQRLTNLASLDFSYNNLTVQASSSGSFLPQIATLRLASCNLNVFPNLKNQSRLFQLDLSDNQISGEIPNWIWEVGDSDLNSLNLSHNNLVGLQEPYIIPDLIVLDLHSNLLQGKLPLPPSNVIYVDYSKNLFSSIPAEIGNFLTFTIFFSLSDNTISGPIPESICNATLLEVLDLSNNRFSGSIPKCLIQHSRTLGVLNLRRNNLTGIVFDTFPETCALQTLDLNGNLLEGTVPKSLANCTVLEVLNLGNNQINDIFPCWLKNISSLRVLVLRSNQFYGNISCQEINGTWPNLQIIDLAINNFDGTLPVKYSWKAMMADEDEAQSQVHHLQFQFLQFSHLYYQDTVTVTSKGLEMEIVKILTLFTSIDLSNNNFEGSIPEETGLLKSLRLLNLSHNALTGPILLSIGNLQQLESLDLSANQLEGEIPTQLASLSFLSVLNLSDNHLVGRIPSGTQLQTFSASDFEGNEGLCGPPLTNNCTTNSNLFLPSSPASSKNFDWQFIVIGIGFGIGSAVVVAPVMFSDKVNQWYDDHIIDKLLMVILPMFGAMYKTSHQRRIEAEQDLEGLQSEEDEDDFDETETEEFHGRYCVFCSKLDITRKRVVHDPKCTCHQSPPISSSTSTSSSSSSLEHFDKS
ncbi:receptor-like protein 7 [Mangifera indica]|uniref:receptor-like protein 7 n=1 Tax=Mangifera indica TaxID=29780 RepID=UPI001CFA3C24|nr:receptor-like protein 7 [Mangifera indica]